jgi:membrane protein YdbS with pleckstrin-like domain
MQMKEKDLVTVNLLILELATMVVAIAMAFTAQLISQLRSITLYEIIEFFLITVIVIWFWWIYVMERLEYPPKSDVFPVYDVLILISISLIPLVYRNGGLRYLSALFSFMMLSWSFMIYHIIKEHSEDITKEEEKFLRTEAKLRICIVIFSSFTALISFYSTFYSIIIFSLVTLFILMSAYVHKISRINILKSHRRWRG